MRPAKCLNPPWRTVRAALLVIATTFSFLPGPGVAAEAHHPRAKPLIFWDAADETGLRFEHFLGATGSFFMPEIMGSGVALIDYDGDGDLDVYFLQGIILDKTKAVDDLIFPAPGKHFPGNRLFRNGIVPSGELHFTDVTEEAGVADSSFGMGAAVGDFDNDGDADLFVTNYGRNTLFRNNGDGTFTDVTKEAGLDLDSFSASAAFADYDRDGDLDLFVTRYNAFTVEGNKPCYGHAGGRDYCGPREYFPLPDRLYRNEGDGRFTDVSEAAGVTAAFGNGLGVVCADLNGDGWIDIYVANDKMPNQLWINRTDGTFEDQALLSGVAFNTDGMAEAGMGVSGGDFDNDGDEDLFVTHIGGETNTLYVNDGQGLFDDVTAAAGLAHTSVPFTGFGAQWLDYDNDGRLDLFSANGEVRIVGALRGSPFPYGQTNQLYYNDGSGFRDVSSRAGPSFQLLDVSRGAAFGDIDNDGDLDIVVSNANDKARLLLNEPGSRNHWLQVRLEGTAANRDGYGAKVGLLRRGQAPMWRRAGSDGSYLSASDPRVHFGLGTALSEAPLERVVVIWPDGRKEAWAATGADKVISLTQGTGEDVDRLP